MKSELSFIVKVSTLISAICLLQGLTAYAFSPLANEFWISTNATGNFYTNGVGGGTIDSPYDGSSQANFDRNMDSMPAYSSIHILAGTYQTLGGGYGWGIKNGQKILGSGIDVTVLQQVFNTNRSYMDQGTVISCANGAVVTNVEVADLTADGNYAYTGGSINCHGVIINGTHVAIRRVKVIHCAKYSVQNSEAWGIVIQPYPFADTTGNVIEDCEVSSFVGGSGISAISINLGSGIIRNNKVFLPVSPGSFAINGSWMHDVLIEGNYVEGAGVGVYGDTGGSTNIIIAHNTFKNVNSGASLDGNPRINITFAFNNVVLTNRTDGGNLIFGFGDWGSSGTVFSNVTIIGNTIEAHGSAYYMAAFDMYNTSGFIFEYNKIDPSLSTNNLSNCTGVCIDNNFDLQGNYLSNVNMSMLGGTPVSSYGISLASSVGQSSALTTLGLPSNPSVIVTNGSTQPISLNTNLTVNGNIIESAGNSYVYDGQNIAYGLTGLSDFFFGNAGNFTMTGNGNTAVGNNSLHADTTGNFNTSEGMESMLYNTTGSQNVAIGKSALQNNTNGSYNVAIGSTALISNTSGGNNTANGFGSLAANTSGSVNTANGNQALGLNTTGSQNTANGYVSLYSNSFGYYNTADGAQALYSSYSGSYNVALGYQAGYNIITGSSNIDIGNPGTSSDNAVIRIGSAQSDTYLTGIIHAPTDLISSGNISANGFTGNGAGLTGINAQQVNAVAATNGTIWSSVSVSNSAAGNWASMIVTPSNAIISVNGVNVAILQTNGVLNAPNGISSTISNKLAMVTIGTGLTSINWTNTTPRNVVFHIGNLTGDYSYNGTTVGTGLIKSAVTMILQPGDFVSANITAGSGTTISARYHPF